jgi:hypothetical protein
MERHAGSGTVVTQWIKKYAEASGTLGNKHALTWKSMYETGIL